MAIKKKVPASGEVSEEAANDRALENFERAVANEPDDDDDGKEEFEVGGGKDDDGDDDEEDERPSRRERRRERGQTLVAQERERAERAEREAAETRRLLAEAVHRMPTPRQEPRPDPERDRLEQEAEGLRQQQEALTERYHQVQVEAQRANRAPDPATMNELRKESWKLRDRMAQNDLQRFAPRGPQQPQITEQHLVAAANRARLMSEHGDVMRNRIATSYFQAEWMKLLDPRGDGSRAGGAQDDWQTLERAMDSARRLAGLPPRGGRPAPSNGSKSKYRGVARGGSGGGEGPATVTMTKETKKLADAAYPYIKDERKRHQYYVNRVGAKTLAKKGA